MVRVAGSEGAFRSLKASLLRFVLLAGTAVVGTVLLYWMFTARILPNQWGVEQVRVGLNKGIRDNAYTPGLYFVPPGSSMQTFPREVQVLEATNEREEAQSKAKRGDLQQKIEEYYAERDRALGRDGHRVIPALFIQTSDGYSVTADVTLIYAIDDPVRIARTFGWGKLYIDSFVINTFRNGLLTTLGKMNAESFFDEARRIAAVEDAEHLLRERFTERGFRVVRLLLRNYRYADNYEKSLHDKKVAVQLTEKNRKESLVNEQRAQLQQIESKGNADITIAESEVNAKIARIRAEAELYSSQARARADTEINVAAAEAKRLKAEALTQAGGRYVVALETAKMFDNIEGAVMSPDQYIQFIRNAWAVIGVNPGTAAPPAAAPGTQGGRP